MRFLVVSHYGRNYTQNVQRRWYNTLNTDTLQPVSKHDRRFLLEELKRDLPRSITAYHWLRMQSEWENKIPGVKVHVLCPRGDWGDAALVAFTDGLALNGKQYGIVYAREGRGDKRLTEALLKTRAVPWKNIAHFSSVLYRHIGPVRAAATAAGISLPPSQPLEHLLHYPKDQIRMDQTNLVLNQADVRLDRLSKENLDEVWSLHPYFPQCYKPVVTSILEHNVGFGVFAQKPNGYEFLVAMALHCEHGGIGMLQTHPDYRDRSLLSFTVCNVMLEMKKKGYNPFGVSWGSPENNVPILQKLGFTSVGKTERVVISPY